MENINFLIHLKKEKKLQLVESSEEIKKSYLMKSESNLVSAKILLKNNQIEEAFPLVYYSMYNSLMALLFKIGIKSENHTASIILLKEVFDIDNSSISSVKKERIGVQYYPDFKVIKKDVEDAIGEAIEFNNVLLDIISKLNSEKIFSYRSKFIKLLKFKIK